MGVDVSVVLPVVLNNINLRRDEQGRHSYTETRKVKRGRACRRVRSRCRDANGRRNVICETTVPVKG